MSTWLALALVLIAVGPAQAWTVSLSWAPNPTATNYKVEKSVDFGATWTVVTSTLTLPSYVYTGTEPGLTIFRFSACNANGCATRSGDGLWHSEAWQPPPVPSGLTVL